MKDGTIKVKIIKDDIVDEICKNFTYEFNEYIEFKPHNLDKTVLPVGWSIGLIVGKSGSGKSILLKEFGDGLTVEWDEGRAIASHFGTYKDATEKLMGVGLASIPAWLKPYNVLSNGEKHKADLARIINSDIVVDEFCSYVDNESALSLSNSIFKLIKSKKYKNVVFATLNRNIVQYLNPDWVYDTDNCTLTVNSKIYDVESLQPIIFKKKHHFMEFM